MPSPKCSDTRRGRVGSRASKKEQGGSGKSHSSCVKHGSWARRLKLPACLSRALRGGGGVAEFSRADAYLCIGRLLFIYLLSACCSF